MQLQYLMTNLKVLSDMFLSDSIRMNISKADEMAKFDRNTKENLCKIVFAFRSWSQNEFTCLHSLGKQIIFF